jgi:hypothetical protein
VWSRQSAARFKRAREFGAKTKGPARQGAGYFEDGFLNLKNAVAEQISHRNICNSKSCSSGSGHALTITIAAPHFSHGVVASFRLTSAMPE